MALARVETQRYDALKEEWTCLAAFNEATVFRVTSGETVVAAELNGQ
jgi:hypothetical protein